MRNVSLFWTMLVSCFDDTSVYNIVYFTTFNILGLCNKLEHLEEIFVHQGERNFFLFVVFFLFFYWMDLLSLGKVSMVC